MGGANLIVACERTGSGARGAAASGVGGFSARDVAWLDEVADTILPDTDTPGAKAAQTGAFMALMVTDTYEAKDQEIFRAGMTALDQACTAAHGHGFMDATPEERLSVLNAVDREQKEHQDNKKGDDPDHYFRMMKQLALLGYFTSEIGCTQALRYVESPGRFDPCVPYAKGEKAWAGHA